jgi:hypothetical protein
MIPLFVQQEKDARGRATGKSNELMSRRFFASSSTDCTKTRALLNRVDHVFLRAHCRDYQSAARSGDVKSMKAADGLYDGSGRYDAGANSIFKKNLHFESL